MNCENCGAEHNCVYKVDGEMKKVNESNWISQTVDFDGCKGAPEHSCRFCGFQWKK